MTYVIAGLGPPMPNPVVSQNLSALFALPATEIDDPYEAAAAIPFSPDRLANQATLFTGRTGVTFYFGVSKLPQTNLSRTFDYRWEGAQRIGRRVAQQYLGPGEETVSIEGVIYPPVFGSFEAIEAMRREAMSGTPRAFVTAYGRYNGLWCIKSIRDKQAPYWPDGHPRKVEFTLELVHYGPDAAGFGVGLMAPLITLVPDPLAVTREPLSRSATARESGSAAP
jgi:phage protein U